MRRGLEGWGPETPEEVRRRRRTEKRHVSEAGTPRPCTPDPVDGQRRFTVFTALLFKPFRLTVSKLSS
jgi:hypothetical protein